MNKLLIQFLVMVFLFFATWFALNQIDWVKRFDIEQKTTETEEKLGDIFWEMIEETEEVMHADSSLSTLNKILDHICKKNEIDRSKIKFHLVKNDEINAFVLPNNHLVVYSGLIEASENEAELCGVLCHEIAHIERKHVMKKLGKELGLSVLISIAAGNSGGGQVVKEALKTLSSTAYDRSLETEADMTAIDYLINADIDPEPLANFLYRLSQEEGSMPKQLYLLSTHPDSEERAERIIKSIEHKHLVKESILSEAAWEALKAEMREN